MAGRSATSTAEAIDDARAKVLKSFITKVTRKDDGAVFTFDGSALDVPVIPTGALSLDYALGVGGLPRGRIVEIYGPESVGKTSLALSVCAQAVKGGGMVGYVDVEHAIDETHLAAMGVDKDFFALAQPSSGEQALDMVEQMVKEDIFDVIVIDSVAALTPQAELDGEMSDQTVGMQARLMSRALRRLTGPVGQSKAVVIFINQLREKIGVMYGSPETTPGGKALKYYASVRLDIRAPAGKNIKGPNGKDNIGLGTIVTVKKNKVAPPQKKAEYNLIWGHGIDFAASVFDVAKELGIIYEMPGFYYAVRGTGEVFTGEDGKQLKGKDRIKALFSANPLVAAEIADQCYRKMAEDRTPVEFAAILDGGEPDPETRSDGVDPLDYDGGDLT